MDGDPGKYVRLDRLKDRVYELIMDYIQKYIKIAGELDDVNARQSSKDAAAVLKNEKNRLLARHEQISGITANLYNDFTEGVLSEVEYLDMKKEYAGELEDICARSDEVDAELDTFKKGYCDTLDIGKACRKYADAKEINREMVECFVKKIVCHTSDRFDVYYCFDEAMKRLSDLLEQRKGRAV